MMMGKNMRFSCLRRINKDGKPQNTRLPVFAYHDRFSGFVSIPQQGREVMLCRLIPSVERLCRVADVGRRQNSGNAQGD